MSGPRQDAPEIAVTQLVPTQQDTVDNEDQVDDAVSQGGTQVGDSPNAVTFSDESLAYPYPLDNSSQSMDYEATPAIAIEEPIPRPSAEGATHPHTQPTEKGLGGTQSGTLQHLGPWNSKARDAAVLPGVAECGLSGAEAPREIVNQHREPWMDALTMPSKVVTCGPPWEQNQGGHNCSTPHLMAHPTWPRCKCNCTPSSSADPPDQTTQIKVSTPQTNTYVACADGLAGTANTGAQTSQPNLDNNASARKRKEEEQAEPQGMCAHKTPPHQSPRKMITHNKHPCVHSQTQKSASQDQSRYLHSIGSSKVDLQPTPQATNQQEDRQTGQDPYTHAITAVYMPVWGINILRGSTQGSTQPKEVQSRRWMLEPHMLWPTHKVLPNQILGHPEAVAIGPQAKEKTTHQATGMHVHVDVPDPNAATTMDRTPPGAAYLINYQTYTGPHDLTQSPGGITGTRRARLTTSEIDENSKALEGTMTQPRWSDTPEEVDPRETEASRFRKDEADGLFEGVSEEENMDELKAGTRCYYKAADGKTQAATISKVHHDDPPPYYTIQLKDGAERSTVRARLIPAQEEGTIIELIHTPPPSYTQLCKPSSLL